MNKNTNKEKIFWLIIILYIGLIYSTVSIVSVIRKFLTERFGYACFDYVYYVFILIGIFALAIIIKRFKKDNFFFRISVFTVTILIYIYYLSNLKYAVERIHFLQYGILGALFYYTINFRINFIKSFFLAAIFSFWVGLGDEAVQWVLPNRVGEIKDSLINLISAFLGIISFINLHNFNKSDTKKSNNFIFISLILTIVFTDLFLINIHGFGNEITDKKAGIFYSSFTRKGLLKANNIYEEGQEMPVFVNEAIRHLHQREFYYHNEFLAKSGIYYKRYDKAYFENQILEDYYHGFIRKNKKIPAKKFIKTIDEELAEKIGQNRVAITDSLKSYLNYKKDDYEKEIYRSRVKNTIIRTFDLKDLIFYSLIILLFLFGFRKYIQKKKN